MFHDKSEIMKECLIPLFSLTILGVFMIALWFFSPNAQAMTISSVGGAYFKSHRQEFCAKWTTFATMNATDLQVKAALAARNRFCRGIK